MGSQPGIKTVHIFTERNLGTSESMQFKPLLVKHQLLIPFTVIGDWFSLGFLVVAFSLFVCFVFTITNVI